MNNFKYIKLGVLITTLSLAGSLFNACNDDIELPVPNTCLLYTSDAADE